MVKPETQNTPLLESTNDSSKKEKHVTLIQESSSVTSLKDAASKSTNNLVSSQSDIHNEDPKTHLGIFEHTIESLNAQRGVVAQEKTLHQLEIQNKKENMRKWEKRALKVCCGRSTTYAISILAPMEMIVMVMCLFISVSFFNVKFMSVDELKRLSIPRKIDSRRIIYVSDHHDHAFDRIARTEGILHVNLSDRAINILNGCGVNYVYDIHPNRKRQELSKWTAVMLIGFIVRIIATVPLFFVRRSDVQESLEGKRLCFIYFVMQPLGFAFVLSGALNIRHNEILCELDYLYGQCCLRTVYIYFGILWTILFKTPELTILCIHWKALHDQMDRDKQFRKAIALQKKQRAEENKCGLFPSSVSFVNKNKQSGNRNLGSSNDCCSSSKSKHRSSSRAKNVIPIDITRMSSFVDTETRMKRDSMISDDLL